MYSKNFITILFHGLYILYDTAYTHDFGTVIPVIFGEFIKYKIASFKITNLSSSFLVMLANF